MRVLIVDFEATECFPIESWLTGWSAKVTRTSDISNAIAEATRASLADSPFHAIIIHTNSYQKHYLLTIPRKFHEFASSGYAPLILCIAAYDSATIDDLLTGGFSSVLPFPMDKRLLFHALHASPEGLNGRHGVASLIEYYATKQVAKGALRVLAATNCLITQECIEYLLDRNGYHVKFVANGEYVLDTLQRETYDVLILDMYMPPHIEAINIIKGLRFLQLKDEEIPIIVCAAEMTSLEAEECRTLGVETFLPKPFSTDSLLTAIEAIRNRQREEKMTQALRGSSGRGGKQVIDLTTLAELETFSTDSGFVPELIQAFIIDNDALYTEMKGALVASRIQTVKDALHGMKGSAASIGAEQLADLCSELISEDPTTLSTDSANISDRIAKTLTSTYTALAEYLKNRHRAIL
jgi:two-component system, sensor histidine kinase RpfC